MEFKKYGNNHNMDLWDFTPFFGFPRYCHKIIAYSPEERNINTSLYEESLKEIFTTLFVSTYHISVMKGIAELVDIVKNSSP